MKKILAIITGVVILSALCVSCDKVPVNGKLDGWWQIMEIHYKTSRGTYDSIVPMKEKQAFWAVQLELMSLQSKKRLSDTLTTEILNRFHYTGDSLHMFNFYKHYRSEDILITDPNTRLLMPMGIKGIKADFRIDVLNRSNMELTSDYARILFRKY